MLRLLSSRFSVLSLILALSISASIVPALAAKKGDPEKPLNLSIQMIDGVETVKNGEETIGTVAILPKGMLLYHWGDEESCTRWAKTGIVDEAEMKFLRDGTNQAQGGGFYVSASPIDSMSFGEEAVRISLSNDFRILQGEIPTDGPQMTVAQDFLLANKISAIEPKGERSQRWIVLLDSETTRGMTPFHKSDVYELLQKNVHMLADISAFTLRNFVKDTNFTLNREQSLDLTRYQAKAALDTIEKKGTYDIARLFAIAEMFPSEETLPAYSNVLENYEKKFKKSGKVSRAAQFQLELDWATEELTKRTPLADRFVLNRVLPPGAVPKGKITYILKTGVTDIPPGLFKNLSVDDLWRFTQGRDVKWMYPSGEFAQKLLSTLQFMPIQDFIVEVAKGNSVPWTIYDRPGKPPVLETWDKLWKDLTSQTVIQQEAYIPLAVRVNQTLNGPNAQFRDLPSVSGGSRIVGGKGYYSISAEEYARLQANPLLSLEAIPDPENPTRYLARHEHPSSRTYRKFESKLSKKLVARLKKAESEGLLVEATDPVARQLTQDIIRELIPYMDKNWEFNEPLDRQYAHLTALRPFPELSDVTNRAFIRMRSFNTSFMVNPDLVLFADEASLVAERLKNERRLQDLQTDLARAEKLDPNFPRYYERPELYRVATGSNEPDMLKFSQNLPQIRQEILNHPERIFGRTRFVGDADLERLQCVRTLKRK